MKTRIVTIVSAVLMAGALFLHSSAADEPAKQVESGSLIVIDSAGNAVSCIQSNYGGYGSGLAVGGFGLQNRGAYFSLEKPELQALRRLIDEARSLHEFSDGTLKISRYQAGLWDELSTGCHISTCVISIQQLLYSEYSKGIIQ